MIGRLTRKVYVETQRRQMYDACVKMDIAGNLVFGTAQSTLYFNPGRHVLTTMTQPSVAVSNDLFCPVDMHTACVLNRNQTALISERLMNSKLEFSINMGRKAVQVGVIHKISNAK